MLNSLLAAYRNAVPVPLYRGHTIYHPIDHTFRKVGRRAARARAAQRRVGPAAACLRAEPAPRLAKSRIPDQLTPRLASRPSSSPLSHTRQLRIRMWPRHRNFGLTASPLIETLCGLAGLSNATVKLNGRRRNIDNVVKAFMHAVTSQGLPHDGVEGSGVYVREVYHRGKLPLGLQRGVDV